MVFSTALTCGAREHGERLGGEDGLAGRKTCGVGAYTSKPISIYYLYSIIDALRSLSPPLSLSAALDRLLAAGEQVGSGTITSERRGRREGRRAPLP